MKEKVPEKDRWGPFVSNRAWGTVREDYSENGDAWSFFPFDHAHLRAFRWGEDAIAGLSDRYQVLIFAPAFWNGKDPILKERLFGLNPYEANHGEDVKELYYPLDANPDHSYLKFLYKYPQETFPYDQLRKEGKKRGKEEREYEILDTGIFDQDRYFDITIEYAKKGADDIAIRIEAINRGPEAAPLHILPQLLFRNQWSWWSKPDPRPKIFSEDHALVADDSLLLSPHLLKNEYHLGKRYLSFSKEPVLLFTENETNRERLWNEPNLTPFVKDAFNRYLIQKEKHAVNPKNEGTKAALHYFSFVKPGESMVIRLRLSERKEEVEEVDEMIEKRRKETDQFYQKVHPAGASEEEKEIQRRALSGMIWNKQLYYYDVGAWIKGDNEKAPPASERRAGRNAKWRHFVSMKIFSMPDKWEYPWFAAWDLAFHTVSLSLIDLEGAKEQLLHLIHDLSQHPNGAIPAYEWEFGDANPPVHAWAALKLFEKEPDFAFLERCFQKLILNFMWWVNRTDPEGKNIFEGGFLGLDNIAILDRSMPLPDGHHRDQADGSGWMALFSLNLMRIALKLAEKNQIYEQMGIKFFEHYLYLSASIRKCYWRPYDLFHAEDGFFYSVWNFPDRRYQVIPVRSVVGLIPLFASDVWREEELKRFPEFWARYEWIGEKKPWLYNKALHQKEGKILLSLAEPEEIRRVLERVWDPEEFRSEYGLRSLSKAHKKNPYITKLGQIRYEPGEAEGAIKGGNSNWRGPIWFPMNYLMIETLERLEEGLGSGFTIGVKGEKRVSLREMANGFRERLLRLYKGERPALQNHPKEREFPLHFYEFFHGESGRGLGASHQTGWTALIANLINRKD
jgi:hypothetical protein